MQTEIYIIDTINAICCIYFFINYINPLKTISIDVNYVIFRISVVLIPLYKFNYFKTDNDI